MSVSESSYQELKTVSRFCEHAPPGDQREGGIRMFALKLTPHRAAAPKILQKALIERDLFFAHCLIAWGVKQDASLKTLGPDMDIYWDKNKAVEWIRTVKARELIDSSEKESKSAPMMDAQRTPSSDAPAAPIHCEPKIPVKNHGIKNQFIAALLKKDIGAMQKLDKEEDHYSLLRKSFSEGEIPEEFGSHDQGVLHIASQVGDVDVWNALIEMHFDPKQYDGLGQTPFLIAVRFNHIPLVQSMMESGVIASDRDHNGDYPIHWAVQNNHLDMVKLLCNYDPSVLLSMNENGLTPKQLAHQLNHSEIDRFLTEKAKK